MHQHQHWTASRPVKAVGSLLPHNTSPQPSLDDRHSSKLWAQAWDCQASTPVYTLAQLTHRGTSTRVWRMHRLLFLKSVSATPIPAAPIEGASPPAKPCVGQSLPGTSPLSCCKSSVQADNSSCRNPLPTTHAAKPAPPQALLLLDLQPQVGRHRPQRISSPWTKLHLIAQLPMPLLVHHRRHRSLVNS
jgi:hypothetical protein